MLRTKLIQLSIVSTGLVFGALITEERRHDPLLISMVAVTILVVFVWTYALFQKYITAISEVGSGKVLIQYHTWLGNKSLLADKGHTSVDIQIEVVKGRINYSQNLKLRIHSGTRCYTFTYFDETYISTFLLMHKHLDFKLNAITQDILISHKNLFSNEIQEMIERLNPDEGND